MPPKKVDTKRFRDALNKLLPAIKSTDQMRKYGEQAASMIKLRTRLGYGVGQDGGEKSSLKPLAKSTIEVRKGNLAFFKSPSTGKPIPYKPDKNGAGNVQLHPETRPSKSNLTRTGQLLDSEGVTAAGYGSVKVGPSGSRTDSKLTNQQVAKYVTDGGRPFNHLSKVEIKRLQDAIKKQLREAIKRVLTKR
jgi:hypothetical protein